MIFGAGSSDHVGVMFFDGHFADKNFRKRVDCLIRSEVNIELNFPPKLRGARSRLYRRRFLQVNTRWKALAEIYTMHSFAPFWNRIPKNEENHGGKRSWSNPGKIGQGKLIGSCNSLPSATLARDLE